MTSSDHVDHWREKLMSPGRHARLHDFNLWFSILAPSTNQNRMSRKAVTMPTVTPPSEQEEERGGVFFCSQVPPELREPLVINNTDVDLGQGTDHVLSAVYLLRKKADGTTEKVHVDVVGYASEDRRRVLVRPVDGLRRDGPTFEADANDLQFILV